MKFTLDQKKCLGCGACYNVCPGGIIMVDGKAAIKNDKADCLERAVEICPIKIIKII